MPYSIRKIRNEDAYSVKNTETGKVHSKHTTKKNALAQVRLLGGGNKQSGVSKTEREAKANQAAREAHAESIARDIQRLEDEHAKSVARSKERFGKKKDILASNLKKASMRRDDREAAEQEDRRAQSISFAQTDAIDTPDAISELIDESRYYGIEPMAYTRPTLRTNFALQPSTQIINTPIENAIRRREIKDMMKADKESRGSGKRIGGAFPTTVGESTAFITWLQSMYPNIYTQFKKNVGRPVNPNRLQQLATMPNTRAGIYAAMIAQDEPPEIATARAQIFFDIKQSIERAFDEYTAGL